MGLADDRKPVNLMTVHVSKSVTVHEVSNKLPTKEGCNFLYFTFAINRSSPLSVSDRINSTMRSIEVAQKSWIALYDKYADGKLERDFFEREEAV